MSKKCIFILTLLVCMTSTCLAQKKIILASVWGVPFFQSGFGIGQLGFEYQQKNEHQAWQISLGMSGGSIASDVGVTKRQWVSLDRIITLSGKKFSEDPLFLSFFIEAGSRTQSPGRRGNITDSVLQQYRATEINPGIGIGKYVHIGKKIRMQLVAAPKVLLAFHKDEYYSRSNRVYFTDQYNELRFGYRLSANFCIRL
ncbi:MAG: hypothetical protein NTW29_20575 [Bacteroidetes bacterium]|nr:hypothetical protein [Bacteroidota bacterium]